MRCIFPEAKFQGLKSDRTTSSRSIDKTLNNKMALNLIRIYNIAKDDDELIRMLRSCNERKVERTEVFLKLAGKLYDPKSPRVFCKEVPEEDEDDVHSISFRVVVNHKNIFFPYVTDMAPGCGCASSRPTNNCHGPTTGRPGKPKPECQWTAATEHKMITTTSPISRTKMGYYYA
uniref:Uncharacterized protein n=1 Tax=Romanomermis culicivorax TaxID=13658 RepID=A0A915HLZ2_ROMCU